MKRVGLKLKAYKICNQNYVQNAPYICICLGLEVVMLDGWSEVVEDYILAENIIRIGTIHAAVPYTDTQTYTHMRWKKIPIHIVDFFVYCCFWSNQFNLSAINFRLCVLESIDRI